MADEIIKNIKSIKGFGIFTDYAHYAGLPDFARYNLIYGWNGTGKTTLTRLLRCFEKEEMYADFATGTFSLERPGAGMAALTHETLNGLSGRLKIFNRDFIEENLDLDIKRGGKAKPVAHVGKANIEKSEQLKKLKTDIKTAADQKDVANGKVETKITALDKLASAIGSEIKAATQTARKDGYKNYNKANVKAAYDANTVKEVTLAPEEYERLKASISSENKAEIVYAPPEYPDLKALQDEVAGILTAKILSDETIERLKDNPVIEAWVKDGLGVHNHEAGKHCEFCGNPFTSERLAELTKHFSGARQKFLDFVDEKIAAINEQKNALAATALPNQAELFSEFVDDFKATIPTLNKVRRDAGIFLDKLTAALTDKKKNLEIAVTMQGEAQESLTALKDNFLKPQSDIQTLVAKHNKKVKEFDASIQADKETIEHHFLNTRQAEYRALEIEIAALKVEFDVAEAAHKKLEDDKDSIEKEIQETRIACETINGHLQDYLGHGEIQFEDFNDGYLIKRNGEVAKNLSEGEKTAIAFVYFINSLKDNFNPATSVIVIDDPISSLDANNIHHAFHFMVAHTKEAAQLFVLTHNFSFLRKVKQWFRAAKIYDEIEAGYFQLVCIPGASGKRMSRITKLDPLLKNYDSEYHYLFKLLVDCDNRRAANDDIPYEELYPLVNAGRKVLETFLDFKYPQNPDKFSQLKNAKAHTTGEVFDPTKAELLYGLLNDGSHAGFDTGGFDTFRNSPDIIKRAIETLLDFIEAVDLVHYQNICKCKGIKARAKVIAVTEIGQVTTAHSPAEKEAQEI